MLRRSLRPVAAPVSAALALGIAMLALGMVAGCGAGTGSNSGGGQAASSTPMTGCGTARTAAGVQVEVEIKHGSVACQAALAVERDYSRAVASGKVRGAGGGAPVTIQGWVCKGFPTPEVLATGHTSACRKGSSQILAVLKMSATSSPSAASTPSS
jgi:hypothetical protein